MGNCLSSPAPPQAEAGTKGAGDAAPAQGANGAQAAPLYAGQQPGKPAAAPANGSGAAPAAPTAAQPGAQPTVGSALKSLSAVEANAVQGTLLKVRCVAQA